MGKIPGVRRITFEDFYLPHFILLVPLRGDTQGGYYFLSWTLIEVEEKAVFGRLQL